MKGKHELSSVGTKVPKNRTKSGNIVTDEEVGTVELPETMSRAKSGSKEEEVEATLPPGVDYVPEKSMNVSLGIFVDLWHLIVFGLDLGNNNHRLLYFQCFSLSEY